MKILIFENEFNYVETSFNYVNEIYFNSVFEYKVLVNSQDLGEFKNAFQYDAIIVDISLSVKSYLDGFGILKKLNEIGYNDLKVAIMTANHKIKNSLEDVGLKTNYNIITKPINLNQLKASLKLFLD